MSIRILRLSRKRLRAFSIIEVVLALGVVAFALVAILGVFPAALSQSRKGVSDTRATQLVKMIVATIDAQASSFGAIDCFGATLDLTNSSTGTAAVMLYAAYPSPDPPQITNTKNANSIYSVEIRFNNVPPVAPSTTLPAGTVNQLQIRIRGLSTVATDYIEFMYLARKKG
jgi:uncharacterized protein (TIGR02598 family)